jgi:hypothetical protein
MDNELSVAVYDVEVLRGPDETKGGWRNPRGMGFGTAVAYFEKEDLYRFYGPEDMDKLIQDLDEKYVVGFNSVQFDNKVLYGNRYRPKPLIELPGRECDLLYRVICSKFKTTTINAAIKKAGVRKVFDRSCSLNAIALATLKKGKTGSGEHAPMLIRRNKWAEVFAYNLNDVRITYQLFDYARQWGFIIDGAGMKVNISV